MDSSLYMVLNGQGHELTIDGMGVKFTDPAQKRGEVFTADELKTILRRVKPVTGDIPDDWIVQRVRITVIDTINHNDL